MKKVKKRPILANVAPTELPSSAPIQVAVDRTAAAADAKHNDVPTKPKRRMLVANAAPIKVTGSHQSKMKDRPLILNNAPTCPGASSSVSTTRKNEQRAEEHQRSTQSYLNMPTMYAGALRRSDQYFIIGEEEAVALPGWDESQCQIRSDEYFIISPLVFTNARQEPITIMACTCDASSNQCRDLRELDSSMPLSAETINIFRGQYCVHRSAVESLEIRLQLILADDQSSDVIEIEQHANDPLLIWSVKIVDGTYGLVRRSQRGHHSCLICKKRMCNHVSTFLSERSNFEIEIPPVLPVEETSVILSQGKVQLCSGGMLAKFSFPVKGNLSPSPSTSICEHGASWEDRPVKRTCIIYDVHGQPYESGPISCRESKGPCHCKLLFDGNEKGLVNVNNQYLVEYTLLFSYMSHFGRDGLPLTAFHDSLQQFNRDMSRDTIPYEIMYRAWTGFADLISYDENSAFTCLACGKFPPIVVLDGTALSCRKDLVPKTTARNTNDTPTLHGIPHEKRVFVSKQKTRRLLHQFGTGEIKGKEKAMTSEEVETLVRRIGEEFPNSPWLKRLIERLSNNGRCKADSAYRLLLQELSKNTPICGHIQIGRDLTEATAALRAIISGACDLACSQSIGIVRKMRVWFPAILECLLPIRKRHGTIPEDVRKVIEMLLDDLEQQAVLSSVRSANEYSDIEETGGSPIYFPNWPVVRGYGNYGDERASKDEADTCSKYRHGHRVLGPGIMLYLCPHGVCYGFSVMENCESPRMAFEVFSSRFVPANVIYDNACKLHVYCLKREPLMFSRTRFFIDRFHWKNHTACSIGYDLDRYSADSALAGLNSQVNEQLNSCLQKLRRSLSYMTYKKFMAHLKLFLYLYNRRKIANVL